MLVCCCGVGGTGKTVTVNRFLERNPGWLFVPSIVREYYASRGVASEGDYLRDMPPEQRYSFQVGLLDYYMTSLARVMAANPGRDLIMDRSAFDHVAYCAYAHPGMTLSQLRAATDFGRRFAALDPVILWFPYPTSWSGTRSYEDGFRATEVGKNFVVCAVMERVLRDLYPVYLTIREGIVDDRVDDVETCLRQVTP